MDGILPRLRKRDKVRLKEQSQGTTDARLRIRCLIILNLADGQSPSELARILKVSRTTIYKWAARYRANGIEGLTDLRVHNGKTKVDEAYLSRLQAVVAASPIDFEWRRPTWTRELLIKTLERETGTRIHPTTMTRALRRCGCRRGTPRPTLGCPWSKRRKRRRLMEIESLVESLPSGEVVLYEDEVDIHLNPKIGLDWMTHGQQKEVLTPGRNQKRYLAGAMDAATGELIWVASNQKCSFLFEVLLEEVARVYSDARKIHLILDNYCIHKTAAVERKLKQLNRIQLHFLPPYCPDHNWIERLWRDLHANVTRNHRCPDMARLMIEVQHWIEQYNHKTIAA